MHTSKKLATGNINHGRSNSKKDKKGKTKGSQKCIPKLLPSK